ncbi:MAG: radical SAM protein [Raoultibacter sp.]
MIQEYPTRTILNKPSHKPDDWFGIEYIANIYRGCSHACIYCESRSNCYGHKDFDTVQYKPNSDILMSKSLRSKRAAGIIGLGTLADTYNPYEEELGATRKVLKVIGNCRFGVDVCTKSPLITRDIDVLEEISWANSATAKLTITTADDSLAAMIEPHAPPSSARFAALKELSSAGVFNGIMLTPMLPFVTDTAENVEAIVEQAHECGVNFIYTRFGLSIRDGQSIHYMKHVRKIDPQLMRDTYGVSFFCYSKQIEQLRALFRDICDKAGIIYEMKDILKVIRANQQQEQASLF